MRIGGHQSAQHRDRRTRHPFEPATARRKPPADRRVRAAESVDHASVKTPPALPARPARPALPALIGVTAFYAAAFFVLTWPAVTRFRTHWFADDVDGLQNVWNLWWVQRAVVVLHQSPWYTHDLHVPYGSPLPAAPTNSDHSV